MMKRVFQTLAKDRNWNVGSPSAAESYDKCTQKFFVNVFCYNIELLPQKYLMTIDKWLKVDASKIKVCKAALFLNKRIGWLFDYLIFYSKEQVKLKTTN